MPSLQNMMPMIVGNPNPINSAITLYQNQMLDSANQDSVDDFLDVLVRTLQIRLRSIVLLLRNLNNGQGSPYFAQIDRHWFAFEMALRLYQPSLISQNRDANNGTNLCGPNMAILDFAKRDIEGYVRYAVSLFETGSGRFFNRPVQPSRGILTRTPTAISCADYITIASLRNSPNVITDAGSYWEPIRILTKPGLMVNWLKQAGYSLVLDRTQINVTIPMMILDVLTPHPIHSQSTGTQNLNLNHLQNLALDIQIGRTVFLLGSVTLGGLVNNQITVPQYTALTATPRSSMDLHWMLVQQLQAGAANVTVQMHSYGNTPAAVVIPTQAFLWGYNGFVSGDPAGL
jgi:hypothetical protein